MSPRRRIGIAVGLVSLVVTTIMPMIRLPYVL